MASIFEAYRSSDLGDPFEHDEAVEDVNTPIWREVLWPLEWLKLRFCPVYYGKGVPRGGGEPVLVIPGFLSNDTVMFEMHQWLFRIGYKPHFSRIPFNTDCPEETAKALTSRLRGIYQEAGQKVRVVGHSLGGMLARSLAQREPGYVDRVITLGSPFNLVRAHPAVTGMWDHLRVAKGDLVGRNLKASCGTGHCLCSFVKHVLDPDPTEVPQFAIYSRNDGVADPAGCAGENPDHNDEVSCTHVGFAFDSEVYQVLAGRLAEAI